MKTERRHELHSNALATWLDDQIERVRPYTQLIVGVVIAVAVAVGIYGYLASQSSQRSDEGWQRFYVANDARQRGDIEDLVQLAQSADYSGTAVGYWSALSLADFHLNQGVNQLFDDRAQATKSLRAAIDGYAQVADQTKYPMIAERGILGMARAYESLNELDNARKRYEQLASGGDGPFAVEARQRLKDLEDDSTKRFYDWFFQASLPKQSLGGAGIPGMRPDFGRLPQEGSFQSPAPDSDSLLRTPKDKDAPASDAPAESPASDAPAAEAPPADATPQAEAPADKPANDTPAPGAGNP